MDFMSIVTGILVPCVLALFTWLSKLSSSVTELRVKVADEYVRDDSLDDAMAPLRSEIKHIRRVVEAVARNLHVPAVRHEEE